MKCWLQHLSLHISVLRAWHLGLRDNVRGLALLHLWLCLRLRLRL